MHMKKIILKGLLIIFIMILILSIVGYFRYLSISNKISDILTEEQFISLPKSETYKVTSTAKGDNQSKIARLGTDVYTYYLDNSGCVDANARGNDKTMRLLQINENGEVNEFDSIPVWMHGNVLVDETRQLIYYTTYEELFENNQYFGQVKIYTYQIQNNVLTKVLEYVLKDDRIHPYQANPRVGASIDQEGNIAVAYSDYNGTMYVHVYNAQTNEWIEHQIDYYLDTYYQDCNLYPYVRLQGVNHIRLIANRDTQMNEDGSISPELYRDYTRYFAYDGATWNHFIFSDCREEKQSSTPLDLLFDEDLNAHIIIKEGNQIIYYKIDSSGVQTEEELPFLKLELAITFIRFLEVDDHLYYVDSGQGLTGFSRVGYVEIIDASTKKTVYETNKVCYEPYLYLTDCSANGVVDMMVISRDKNYDEHSDTFYLQLQFK